MILKRTLFAMLTASLMFLLACSEDSNPADSNNPSNYEAEGSANTSEGNMEYNFGGAAYDEDNNSTTVALAENAYFFENSNSGDVSYLVFEFEGNSTGTFDLEDELSLFINGNLYIALSGTVNITSYGEVGGYIEGNLSATLQGIQSGTVTISSASFKVKRFEDDDWADDNDDNGDDDDDNGDDDNDDDDNNNYSLKNFELNAGDLNINNINMNTVAAFYHYSSSDDVVLFISGFTGDNTVIGLSLTAEAFGSSPKSVNIDGSDSHNMTLSLNGKSYNFNGTFIVKNWAEVGDYISVEFQGTLTAEDNSSEVKNINKFSFDIIRAQ